MVLHVCLSGWGVVFFDESKVCESVLEEFFEECAIFRGSNHYYIGITSLIEYFCNFLDLIEVLFEISAAISHHRMFINDEIMKLLRQMNL